MTIYTHANCLHEGPNVSHTRRTSAVKLILRGAIVAALGWALYAWRAM